MKLPTYENDNYELEDGELRAIDNPESFWVPDFEMKKHLKVGSLVKLIFCMEETKGADNIVVERMWVKITDKFPEYYKGVLDNNPYGSQCLLAGQLICFQSRHIIDIYEK